MAGWWRSDGGWHSARPWQQCDRTRMGPEAAGATAWAEYGWDEAPWQEHGWAHEDWLPAMEGEDDASEAWEPADSVSALSAGSGAHVPDQYPWAAEQLDVTQGNSGDAIAGTSSEQVDQDGSSRLEPAAEMCTSTAGGAGKSGKDDKDGGTADVEAYIAENAPLDVRAMTALRTAPKWVAAGVTSSGDVKGANNPSAALISRLNMVQTGGGRGRLLLRNIDREDD